MSLFRLAAIAAVNACLLGLIPTAASAADAVSLRLNWLLSGVHSIFYYGVEKGFYKDAGIELTIGEGQGSARTVQVVAAGNETFGLVDGGSIIGGAVRGAPVKAVLGIMNTSPYGISFRADAGVNSIADAAGKTIAATAGEATLALLPAVWKANNVDGAKVKVLNVDGPGKLVAVMEKRTEGLLAGLEGQVIILNQKGLKQKVFSLAELGVNTVGLTIVANARTLGNQDLVKRFVGATIQAMNATRADPAAAVAAALKHKPDADKALLTEQLAVSLTLVPSPSAPNAPTGVMAAADWERTLDLMKTYQDVKTEMTADAFFTNSFIAN
jgi:NitT/TauT family transport system substrate-binding protein